MLSTRNWHSQWSINVWWSIKGETTLWVWKVHQNWYIVLVFHEEFPRRLSRTTDHGHEKWVLSSRTSSLDRWVVSLEQCFLTIWEPHDIRLLWRIGLTVFIEWALKWIFSTKLFEWDLVIASVSLQISVESDVTVPV